MSTVPTSAEEMDPLPTDLDKIYASLFADEDKVVNSLDVYNRIFDHPVLFPLQRKLEMAHMMQIARGVHPKTVFEIGADKGGGLYHWCKCLPSVKRVIACEIRGVPYSSAFEAAFPHIDFLWLPQSSYAPETVDTVREWLGVSTIDCLFIDGDKSYFHKDFFCYESLMSVPGVVFFHDVQDPAPGASFHRVVSATHYEHETYINTIESLDAVAAAKTRPPATAHEGWLRHWKGCSAGLGIVYI